MTSERIYLDYAATAPLLPPVRAVLLEHAEQTWGNASALYAEGKVAQRALEEARATLADVLGCTPPELVFCSGGTEAAGTLLAGVARGAFERAGARKGRRHVLCAAFEHHAVLDAALALRREGYEVELVRPDAGGRVSSAAFAAALRPDTLLAAGMLVQNELGTVQPVAKLAALAHEAGALFISDCVQGFGKLPLSVADLACDAAIVSAHKLGGPKGVGAFYLRRGTPFTPRQLGGGQESGLRSGTQDVAAAAAFACAAALCTPEHLALEGKRLAHLRDALLARLLAGSPRIRATVPLTTGYHAAEHLPGHLHVLVEGIESQTMVLRLDEAGFAVSGGSACGSGSLEPSHVLTSMGIGRDAAYGALRISMGAGTTASHVERFAEALLGIL